MSEDGSSGVAFNSALWLSVLAGFPILLAVALSCSALSQTMLLLSYRF